MTATSDKYSTNHQTKKLLIGLLLLFSIGLGCGILLREPISQIAIRIFDTYGEFGLVLGTLVTDTSPLPLTSEPVAIIGLGANIPLWKVVLIMSATSHFCGPLGYGFGWSLSRLPRFRDRMQQRFPDLFSFMKEHGVKGVAWAAILPIPFALTTWAAGLVGISFRGVVLASSLRWVKTSIYVSLFAGGWILGS